MKSRWFFGLWRVPMYEYLYGYTRAQLELMGVDKPFVAYKKRDDGGKSGVTSEAKQVAAVERWKERRKKRKFNFQEFLQTGAKVATDG